MLGGDSFVKADWVHDLRAHQFKHSTEDHWLIVGKVMLLYFKNQDSYIVCTQSQTFSENDKNSLASMGGLDT